MAKERQPSQPKCRWTFTPRGDSSPAGVAFEQAELLGGSSQPRHACALPVPSIDEATGDLGDENGCDVRRAVHGVPPRFDALNFSSGSSSAMPMSQ